jgi:hypothetical protein
LVLDYLEHVLHSPRDNNEFFGTPRQELEALIWSARFLNHERVLLSFMAPFLDLCILLWRW